MECRSSRPTPMAPRLVTLAAKARSEMSGSRDPFSSMRSGSVQHGDLILLTRTEFDVLAAGAPGRGDELPPGPAGPPCRGGFAAANSKATPPANDIWPSSCRRCPLATQPARGAMSTNRASMKEPNRHEDSPQNSLRPHRLGRDPRCRRVGHSRGRAVIAPPVGTDRRAADPDIHDNRRTHRPVR